jgi:uncharacterized protein (DUF2126 family)
MAIRVSLHHRTVYEYDRMVKLSTQTIRLRPAPHCQTQIEAYSLKIQPESHFINWQQDLYSNYLANVVIPERTQVFAIDVDCIVRFNELNPLNFFLDEAVRYYPFNYPDSIQQELIAYTQTLNHPLLTAWIYPYHAQKQLTIDLLAEINQRLHQEIGYVIRLEPGVQSVEETLTKKLGSCRDMAWLAVNLLRELGLAARFVSGYSIQLKPDEIPLNAVKVVDKDVTDLHAWAEVYLPGAGWVGLDPTSGLFTSNGYIPVCASPNPENAAPVTGLVEPCESRLFFEMSLQRLHEDYRVTKPYLPDEWEAIDRYGQSLDTQMDNLGIRLTFGGEPTFVNLAQQELEEWQTAALGEDKYHKAIQLRTILAKQIEPHGLFRSGQGKWYGNEALPRWSLDYYWRKDGQPLWQNHTLLADFQKNKRPMEICDAENLLQIIAEALGVAKKCVMPAYETTENTICGYVLPLALKAASGQWVSQYWDMVQPLLLTPGQSALGYRLPLHQLPHQEIIEADDLLISAPIFEAKAHLPTYENLITKIKKHFKSKKNEMTTLQTWLRTALCTEIREEQLFVFLPPIPTLECFLELIVAIEFAAKKLQVAIVIEGYIPPADPRLQKLSITPDPGVLEVNIPPMQHWSELKAQSAMLYESAKQLGLSAEKFMLDGRMTGTGGGNHITLGGNTPSDSPLLRRPDVLRSMITFWQHHPSLSYLFSGLFIGPTSQAPRIDEARHDSLYEIEIAFSQLEKDNLLSPWQVDRLLRHLLVDVTGNTHRAEFCIDKLYAPHQEFGRQGLLEMRGFEMPPHSQMFSVQYLLVQTLFTYFWQKPYHKKLIRFGTELHDRYLLPYFLWLDFLDVIEVLNDAGFALKANWFQPFFEFRFPIYGTLQVREINLELRMALEPWHVLGEENNSGTTSRTVDCAMERLQVFVQGLPKERFILTCNHQRVPLHSTGVHGQYVAGVRFKAWQPTYTMHPYLKLDTPLVFDIIDTHHQRAIGGCTYDVRHPGGRHYEEFPINRAEAETRRHDCFSPVGHTPGQLIVSDSHINPEFPCTLDLRLNAVKKRAQNYRKKILT